MLLIACLASMAVLPKLISGFDGPVTDLPYDFRSYIYGCQFLMGIALLYSAGLVISNWRGQSTQLPGLFVTVAAGWIVLAGWVYLRSLLNAWTGISVTRIELIILAALPLALWIRRYGFPALVQETKRMLPELFIFFLLAVAVAQHELPRDIMLSSDPDQHLFFATQIAKLGGVPWHQADWGALPFGYPAGSGVMIVVLSALSLTGAGDATMAIPILQAYLAVLILAGTLLAPIKGPLERIFCLVGVMLVFHYLLPYGFEANHYHLEGYGRLASLWVMALLLLPCITNRWPWKGVNTPFRAWIWSSGIVAFAITLNPINAFLGAILAGFGFTKHFPKSVWLIPALPLICVMLVALDPYYFEFMTGTARQGGVVLINQPTTGIDWGVLIQNLPSGFTKWSSNTGLFFNLSVLPYGLVLLCILLSTSLMASKNNSKLVLATLVLVILLYFSWSLFSAVFDELAADHRFRLLLPYLQYNRYQVMYLVIMILVIATLRPFFSGSRHWFVGPAALLLLGYGLGLHQNETTWVNKKARGGYCGSMGCTTPDDREVLSLSEHLYQELEHTTPVRMLIPNAVSVHGEEKWLMPRGATRSAVLYDTFPLAFYYYQGNQEYTFDNYQQFVCQFLDITWLKSQNIQYLFTPSNMSDSCVYEYKNLGDRFETVARFGNSAIYRLYQ
jgi:hypothetical protein